MREKDQASVKDLFEGAYLLIRGCKITDLQVEIDSRGRKTGTFVFYGEGIEEDISGYRRGVVSANVKQIKSMVGFLKDHLFDEIKKIEREERFKTLRVAR